MRSTHFFPLLVCLPVLVGALLACQRGPSVRTASAAAAACLADSAEAAEYASVVRFWTAYDGGVSYDGWRKEVGLTRADSATVSVVREDAVCRRALAAVRRHTARHAAAANAPSSVAVIRVGRAFVVSWPAASAGEWHSYLAFDAAWRFLAALAS